MSTETWGEKASCRMLVSLGFLPDLFTPENIVWMLSNSGPWPAVASLGTWGRALERMTKVLEGLTIPTVSLSPAEDRSEASATALNLTTGSIGSINMSVDIDGTTYAGESLGT